MKHSLIRVTTALGTASLGALSAIVLLTGCQNSQLSPADEKELLTALSVYSSTRLTLSARAGLNLAGNSRREYLNTIDKLVTSFPYLQDLATTFKHRNLKLLAEIDGAQITTNMVDKGVETQITSPKIEYSRTAHSPILASRDALEKCLNSNGAEHFHYQIDGETYHVRDSNLPARVAKPGEPGMVEYRVHGGLHYSPGGLVGLKPGPSSEPQAFQKIQTYMVLGSLEAHFALTNGRKYDFLLNINTVQERTGRARFAIELKNDKGKRALLELNATRDNSFKSELRLNGKNISMDSESPWASIVSILVQVDTMIAGLNDVAALFSQY